MRSPPVLWRHPPFVGIPGIQRDLAGEVHGQVAGEVGRCGEGNRQHDYLAESGRLKRGACRHAGAEAFDEWL